MLDFSSDASISLVVETVGPQENALWKSLLRVCRWYVPAACQFCVK